MFNVSTIEKKNNSYIWVEISLRGSFRVQMGSKDTELQRYKEIFRYSVMRESKLNRNKDEFNEYKERLG